MGPDSPHKDLKTDLGFYYAMNDRKKFEIRLQNVVNQPISST